MAVAIAGIAIAAAGVGMSAYESYKAGKEQERIAKMTKDMANFNANVAEGQGRQAMENAEYDAMYAGMQTMYELYLMEYNMNQVRNEALYEANVAKQIDMDGGINAIRKRKNDLLQLSEAEAIAAGSGALVAGSVLEALVESAKNLEIDTLEINRLSKVESNERLYRSMTLESQAGLIGQQIKTAKRFGDMQVSEILKQGRLQQQDFNTEAKRLRAYGEIQANSQLGMASQYRRQAVAQGVSGAGNIMQQIAAYNTRNTTTTSTSTSSSSTGAYSGASAGSSYGVV